jgi:hypothetical protein
MSGGEASPGMQPGTRNRTTSRVRVYLIGARLKMCSVKAELSVVS